MMMKVINKMLLRRKRKKEREKENDSTLVGRPKRKRVMSRAGSKRCFRKIEKYSGKLGSYVKTVVFLPHGGFPTAFISMDQ